MPGMGEEEEEEEEVHHTHSLSLTHTRTLVTTPYIEYSSHCLFHPLQFYYHTLYYAHYTHGPPSTH